MVDKHLRLDMPWIPYQKPPGEVPAHYEWPLVLSDDTVLGRNNEYAKEQRRAIGRFREELLKYQKECGQRKDMETARFFRDEASETMKQFRGWEGAIKVIEDANDWLHSHVAEQIAPYVDRAFALMELQSTET